MDSIKFISNYQLFIDEIRNVIRADLLPTLEEIEHIDPHDLIRPDTWFQGEGDARGFVWSLFIKKALYNSDFKRF